MGEGGRRARYSRRSARFLSVFFLAASFLSRSPACFLAMGPSAPPGPPGATGSAEEATAPPASSLPPLGPPAPPWISVSRRARAAYSS